MKKVIVISSFLAAGLVGAAQTVKYVAKAGSISFSSKASLENIDAKSSTASSVISTDGAVAFSVLIKSFKFKKSLMEEHFNETYMESSKKGMDKSTFKGTIEDKTKVDFTKDGTYKVNVKGVLNMHGVNQNVTTPATITVKAGKINATCTFNVKLADYKIKIPATVKNNIAETVSITVNADYNKM